MKETAVEWLIEKLKSQGLLIGEPDNLVAVREAKEMEKEQSDERYFKGIDFYDTKFKNKCEHNRSDDPKAFAKEQFIGYYCSKCDEIYCGLT